MPMLDANIKNWPNFKELFPGRDLVVDWKSRRRKSEVPGLVKLPWTIDFNKLQSEFLRLEQTDLGYFERDVIYDVMGLRRLNTSPRDYWRNILTSPSKLALQFQEQCDLIRGFSWQQHQKNISKSRLTRSLIELNHDYDPLVDERNYTQLMPYLENTYFQELLSNFKARVNRVRIVCLAPGKHIIPHADSDPRYGVRAHIPILTNPHSKMGVKLSDGSIVEHIIELGSVYILNGGLSHWAYNNGQSDRIHLVIGLDGQEDYDQKGVQHIKPVKTKS